MTAKTKMKKSNDKNTDEFIMFWLWKVTLIIKQFDIDSTLYLIYVNKPRINAIIKTIGWIDPHDDLINLLKYILNFQSLEINGFGLDLYGTILNFSRALAIVDSNYFSFQGTDLKPLNTALFFRGIFNNAQNLVMSDPYHQMLLKGLFLASMFDGSLHNLNVILQTVFRYTTDGCDRKIAAVRSETNAINIISDIALEEWEKDFLRKNTLYYSYSNKYLVLFLFK